MDSIIQVMCFLRFNGWKVYSIEDVRGYGTRLVGNDGQVHSNGISMCRPIHVSTSR